MSAKHTPAPWFVFSTGHCIGGPKADRDPPTAGIAIFSMGARTPEESAANAAHAVACVNAQPAMLEALKAAREFIVVMRDGLAAAHTGPNGIDADGADGVASDNELIAQIDAALKATGAQP